MIESDGTMVLLGRGSNCINTAGEKVYPEEVEETLKALPWVEDALVFGVEDERFGQKVAAVLSRAPETDVAVEDILAAAGRKIASYKLPRVTVVVDVVPRTQVGKADYDSARRLLEIENGSE
jgi:fatty-acyl-CoA synthase